MSDRKTLTIGEVAGHIGLKKTTLYVKHSRGELPPHDDVKNADVAHPTKLWFVSTIDEWNETRSKR